MLTLAPRGRLAPNGPQRFERADYAGCWADAKEPRRHVAFGHQGHLGSRGLRFAPCQPDKRNTLVRAGLGASEQEPKTSAKALTVRPTARVHL